MVEQARGANVGRPTLWEAVKSNDDRISACEVRESGILAELKILKELQIGTVILVAVALLGELIRIIVGR